jgi:hypothetical protein
MKGKKEDEGQGGGVEVEQPSMDKAEFEEIVVQRKEVQDNSLAKVDVVTSEKKITMSTPVKEYEDFKNSFKNMMEAFVNLVEVAGLEIGKDETVTAISMLRLDLDKIKNDLQSEKIKIRDELVPRSEFDDLKASTMAEEAKRRDEYVPRNEFEELKAATEERAAKASEDYVTRSEFEHFRAAVREVI